VKVVDERLIAGESRAGVQGEEVVGLRVAVVKGVAIVQVEHQVRLVFSPKDTALISKVSVADGHGKLHGDAAEVVVHVLVLPHVPRVTVDDSVEPLHGVGDESNRLSQKATEAT